MPGRRIKAAGKAKPPKTTLDTAGERLVLPPVSVHSARKSRAHGNGSSMPTEEDLSVQGIRLSFLIHDVSRMRRAAYDQFMKPIGITRAQWWVLAHLSRQDGMMQTQLAALLEVGKASLGHVVESLEHDGWVARRSDPSDQRAKRVYLSRSGQSLIKQMTTMETKFNNQLFAEISPEGREHLISELFKIKKAISRLDLNFASSIGSDKGHD